MPAVLSNLSFQGSRIRGLQYPVAPDEPLRKIDGGGNSGYLTWFPFTSSTTLILDHSENGLRFTATSDVYVTIPDETTVAFPVGTSILFEQAGTGSVNFTGASGVIIDVRSVFDKKTAGQYAPATLIKKSSNRWLLSGDLVLL